MSLLRPRRQPCALSSGVTFSLGAPDRRRHLEEFAAQPLYAVPEWIDG
jgi:hypothetical protein